MLVVDFMAYARRFPVKKTKLKTYRDMAKHLWNTLTKHASNYARIKIIFDLCIIYSIKDTEWNINAVEGIRNFLLAQKCFGQLVKIK